MIISLCDHSWAQDVYDEWRIGQKKWHVGAVTAHPTFVPNATASGTCGAHTVGGALVCLTTTDFHEWLGHLRHRSVELLSC